MRYIPHILIFIMAIPVSIPVLVLTYIYRRYYQIPVPKTPGHDHDEQVTKEKTDEV